MRRTLVLIWGAVALAVIVIGWAVWSVASSDRGRPEAEPVPMAPLPTVWPGDATRDGELGLAVVGVDCGRDTVGRPPRAVRAQGVFCLMTIEVRNLGSTPRWFRPDAQWAFSSGSSFAGDPEASRAASFGALAYQSPLAPGEIRAGMVVVFEVPPETQLTRLELHESAGSRGVVVQLYPFRSGKGASYAGLPRGLVEPVFDELVGLIAPRPGWSVADEVATYTWAGTDWVVKVRAAKLPGRSHHRFHVAAIRPDGVAGRTHWAGTAAEAARLAEQAMRNRLAVEAQR